MQCPESWLREFCDPHLSTQQLADTLTMAGLEVEDLQPVAPFFSHVVVGHILEVEKHPDADRLRICKVDIGQAQALSIVCGAPNARVGISVPCAMVGAQLPPGEDGKPFTIKLGKLRGVESQGMLCSARELKISQDSEGLMELPSDAKPGVNIRDYLKLDDTLFTLKLTPNLAHCLSVFGVARELSALTRSPLKNPSFPAVANTANDRLPVQIDAKDLCGRFSGRVIKSLNPAAKTPAWMVQRLERCGQRSISALVDISNYVMFEFGRPTHIFDLQKIQGGLHVRWAKPSESLTLLNGQTVTLDDKVGVIADAKQVESLAGIMGGAATAVSDDTRDIYAEAAFWWPSAIAGRSRRFNFSTDAGHRFERGVDPQTTTEHLEHLTSLILSICGTDQTTVAPIDDHPVNMPVTTPVQLRVERANKVLGTALSQQVMVDALQALGLEVEQATGNLTVHPPSYRFDLRMEEDLIEEIARMVGFENLPTTSPQAPITPKIRPENQRHGFAVRRQLADLGYQETINFSFVDEQWERTLAGNDAPIQLLNPIASQMNVMRSSLIGSLLQVAKFNLDRKAHRVRVFETGRVFRRDPSVQDSLQTVQGIDQPVLIAGLAYGPLHPLGWNGIDKLTDFFDVKSDVCRLMTGHALTFAVMSHPVPHAQSVSRLHPVERDLAIVVSEDITHDALMKCIQQADTTLLLNNATLFDVYRPSKPDASVKAGEKSMAVRLFLQSTDENTLTDAQIDGVIQSVVDALSRQLSARLRA